MQQQLFSKLELASLRSLLSEYEMSSANEFFFYRSSTFKSSSIVVAKVVKLLGMILGESAIQD